MTAPHDSELENALEGLKHRDPERRAGAAIRLLNLRREPVRSSTALATALSDPVAFVRMVAASALAEMGPEARPAITALVRVLSDPDGGVRCRAAMALGELGPEARPGVPGLTKILTTDPHPAARKHAAATLGDLGPAAAPALPALAEALAAPDLLLRAVAGAALLRLLPRSLPRLIDAASHADACVRGHAARLLGKVDRPEATEVLAKLATDADADVRESALASMRTR